jgi:hypothetical protein
MRETDPPPTHSIARNTNGCCTDGAKGESLPGRQHKPRHGESSDLHYTSKFYQEFFEMPLKQHSATTHILGVGNCFFGIEQGDRQGPRVDHFDFGLAGFNADDVRTRLTKLNLKFR